jgi:acyl dehydratase
LGHNTHQQDRIGMSAYQVVAKNFSQPHENKIHSDEIAQKYGFQGALVPGVAVYGHLTHPLVESLGEAWLCASQSSVRFLKPAYDGDQLEITSSKDGADYRVQCHHGSTLLAELHSSLPGKLPVSEDQSVFDAPCKSRERPEISWDTVIEGQPFETWHWQITEDGNQTHASEISDALPIYRSDAHPHWLLSMANRALTREYVMPAWIHAGSEIRLRELLRVGDAIEVKAVVLKKWRSKGHEFIRVYLAYHRAGTLTTEIFHTAIFKVAQ